MDCFVTVLFIVLRSFDSLAELAETSHVFSPGDFPRRWPTLWMPHICEVLSFVLRSKDSMKTSWVLVG